MKHVDIERLKSFSQYDAPDEPPFVVTIMHTFIDSSTPMVEDLSECVSKGLKKQMLEIAHALKSVSANIGAMQLSQLCQQLEADARNGSTEALDLLVTKVQAEFRQVVLELESHLQTLFRKHG